MSLLHMTSKAYVEGEGKDTFKRRPMGTGPYRFAELVTNQRVVGELFLGYWGPKPGFQRIVWRVLPDALTAKNALLAGEVDVYQFVPPESIPEVQQNPRTRIVETISARMLYMVINASESPLDNKLIRQALNYAVDKKAIVEQLYRGKAIALRAGMQETIPEINKSLTGYPYNRRKRATSSRRPATRVKSSESTPRPSGSPSARSSAKPWPACWRRSASPSSSSWPSGGRMPRRSWPASTQG